jgi:outer membrane murein-binding lipoprotein Lpp
MKKFFILFSLVVLAAILSGCQTTNYKQQVDTLSNKVETLESAIQDRDRELSQLQGQVDQMNRQLIDQQKANQAKEKARMAAPDTKDRLGIIKVNVPATDIQAALKEAGFYSGNIDGKVGANTISAIAAFQKANNLPSDSIVGPKTWEALRTYLK